MLRAKRSHAIEKRERERRRALVLEAARAKKDEEIGDQLLSDIIAAVPRTTPALIDEVLQKVRHQDEAEAELLQAAVDQSTMLKVNLDGMDPAELWSEPVRHLWQETIQVLVQQRNRWKITPLTLVHPFYGKVAVVLSLCGKCRAQNEYERMRLFARTLRDGIDNMVDEIHPVMDEKVGKSIPKTETKELLLDISQEILSNNQGELSEDTETYSEDSEDDNGEDFKNFNAEVEVVTADWTKDNPDGESPKLIVTPPQSSPTASSPTSASPAKSGASFMLPFGPELDDAEPSSPATKVQTLTSETSSPMLTRTRAFTDGSTRAFMSTRPQVSRTLFPPQQQLQQPERVVTYTPPPVSFPPSSTMIQPPTASPILKQASEAGIDLSKGYSVIPYQYQPENKRRSPKKPKISDAEKKKKESKKKRPVSSPNYPAAKSRGAARAEGDRDRTANAVRQLQVQQSNQSSLLQQVAEQMNQLTYSLMEMNARNQQ